MILASHDDYQCPHIDWECRECGEVYVSSGYPPETRCIEGHAIGWRPEAEQIEAYIEFLDGLAPGDGIVIVGDGPAPLMGPVESVGDNELTTASLNSPAYIIRWSLDDHKIRWSRIPENDPDDRWYNDVHHVEPVPIEKTPRRTEGQT